MSQVPAKAAAGSAPTVAAVPTFSPYVDAVIRHASSGDSANPVLVPAHLQAAVCKEAARAIPAMKARLAPADFGKWSWFLSPLRITVRNPPTPDAFKAFVATVAASLHNVPAHALLPWRQREAVQRFAFWPSAHDLSDWLAPTGREDRVTLGALEKLAAKPEADDAQLDATEEVYAAVRAKAAAFNAEVKAREKAQREAERITPAARYLSRTELRAALLRLVEGGGTAGQLAQCQLDTLEKNP